MSKFINLELLSHYHQLCTTLTRCLRIERRDGKVIALTEHDTDLVIDNITYQSSIGYTPTALSMQANAAVNTVDIEGILSIAGIARKDIAQGLFDQAQIFVFEVNYENISQGFLPLMRGFWGECQLYEHRYVTEFVSLSQVLQQSIGELYSTTCRATLGDQRCGVKLADYVMEGVVTDVDLDNCLHFTAAGFDQPHDYFQYGVITWKEGKNKDLSMGIRSFLPEKNQFHLVQPMSYPIAVGDIFEVTPGCDKSLSMCKSRFNNVINFRGEPFIPGLDRMLRIP